MVDFLGLMSWHGSWYSIDENTTGSRPMAMWLYGLFVNTCFLSSVTTPGGFVLQMQYNAKCSSPHVKLSGSKLF